ncbi:MAG: YfhO family protein, partial [Bacteroidaceae bacterium]|nr:YfhO family protein [Bacteroidaceae bacterium]
FKEALHDAPAVLPVDPAARVQLVEYRPNHLRYETESSTDGVVVFSEIYYPDWTATVDGQPAPIGRADYVLRAMQVPAGKHVIEMTFDPQSIRTTEAVAWAAMLVLLGGIVAALVRLGRKK